MNHFHLTSEPITPKPVGKRNRRYPEFITRLKNEKKKLKPFIVGDIETILYDGSDIDISKADETLMETINLHFPFEGGEAFPIIPKRKRWMAVP